MVGLVIGLILLIILYYGFSQLYTRIDGLTEYLRKPLMGDPKIVLSYTEDTMVHIRRDYGDWITTLQIIIVITIILIIIAAIQWMRKG